MPRPAGLLLGALIAISGAVNPAASADADESAASERYTALMEQVEGAGRTCMIAQTSNAGIAVAEAFLKDARFTELEAGKPIRVTLPPEFYSPLGTTVTFDTHALAIYRKNPAGPYISMTRTAEGVRIEPRIALPAAEGKLLCVRYYNATVKYRPPAAP